VERPERKEEKARGRNGYATLLLTVTGKRKFVAKFLYRRCELERLRKEREFT